MTHANILLHSSGGRFGIPLALVTFAVGIPLAGLARAQGSHITSADEMIRCESAAASRVVEKVRSGAPGVMVAIFVKVGDPVKKGQLLGHTELDATKLQLDLAQRAMESKANVDAAQSQAEAWTVTREENEEAVRRRNMEESRLDWAIAMEKMYRANYEVQLEAERAQQIQHDYWKAQYEKRFFRASVDGVISEVPVEVGKPVNFATHVFTIRNEDTYCIPVPAPAAVADATLAQSTVTVRSTDGKSISKALVDSVSDDPRQTGGKIIKLLIQASDFPSALRSKLMGMKFDVLLPQVAGHVR